MKKIVVVGSVNTDMVISGRRIPAPGETVTGGKFMMNPGGKGGNQAVAVARLSGRRGACEFIAKVGDDLFGRDALRRMKRDGIAAKFVVDPSEPSGTALILVDDKGQNVISVALGANGALDVNDLAPFLNDIENASVLLLQLETPVKTVLAAARTAHAKGVTVVLNPAPAVKLPADLYRSTDWITPNESEAELLTGVKVIDAASAGKAADIFKKRGVKHVVITMGAKGVYCGDLRKIFPAKKVKAVDCVAAGDTFNGAFAVALSEKMSVEPAICFAQRAATLSVMRCGAQSSIPFRQELDSCCKTGRY